MYFFFVAIVVLIVVVVAVAVLSTADSDIVSKWMRGWTEAALAY